MDWLSSDTAVLEPLLWATAVLCLGWILFMRSLRELKLSDCGNLRIKGFCEEEEQCQFPCRSSLACAQEWELTLEDGVFSTLDLVSLEPWSSSKIPSVLERCLLVGESKPLLCCGSDALSSNLGGFSSKLLLLSVESLLLITFSVRTSSLQKKRSSQFPACVPSRIFFSSAHLFCRSYLFILSGLGAWVRKGCVLLQRQRQIK